MLKGSIPILRFIEYFIDPEPCSSSEILGYLSCKLGTSSDSNGFKKKASVNVEGGSLGRERERDMSMELIKSFGEKGCKINFGGSRKIPL